VLKAVVDTNVFISALLSEGNPRKILRALNQDSFHAYYPEQLILELYRAPLKPRLALRLTAEDISDLVALLARKATLVEVTAIVQVSRDPNDNVFLACAEAMACDFIVSGDKDLLTLGEYAHIQIVSPSQFLDILSRN
jgi:putative PIN family toxin of toxin-antitoxin system